MRGKIWNEQKNIAIFFCQQIDANQDINRRSIEKEFEVYIRFFPLVCSGRIESIHFLWALETGSDEVYLITCPLGTCRHLEGNIRAEKRFTYAQTLISELGFDPKIFKQVVSPPLSIDKLIRELIGEG